jgi:hypothetical protein
VEREATQRSKWAPLIYSGILLKIILSIHHDWQYFMCNNSTKRAGDYNLWDNCPCKVQSVYNTNYSTFLNYSNQPNWWPYQLMKKLNGCYSRFTRFEIQFLHITYNISTNWIIFTKIYYKIFYYINKRILCDFNFS